jgi:pimeloyl-ACP methyl ester carboxylesterase
LVRSLPIVKALLQSPPMLADAAPEIDVMERRITSFDGTDIAYHTIGKGPPILLANGLGGSWGAWKHQIRFFQDQYRFVSWDYRGLYASKAPPDRNALDVPAQARDALAILDEQKIERTAIFGWSMGVQVALELFRRAPDRVAALVLINGVAGSPFRTIGNSPRLGSLAPSILRAARSHAGLVSSVTARMVRWDRTPKLAKALGIAARTLDESLFREIATSFVGLDMEIYAHTLEQLGAHDAHDVLGTIDVPLLMIAGGNDLMTPRSGAEALVKSVKGAELLVVPGGTHYLAVEYPEVLNLRIERFFRTRGYPGRGKP